jgi:hypothetical protein
MCGLSANDLEEPFISAGADFFRLKPIPCKKDDLHRELLRLVTGKRKYFPEGELEGGPGSN